MLTSHQPIKSLRLPTRLRRLEAEAIYIMREAAAEFAKPVMLYSIGKDSSVMLHVARKAFFPGKPSFPLLHIDTTWKFRKMLAFRDETAARLGWAWTSSFTSTKAGSPPAYRR
jgi:sulfate adenylyltransferase subunit 2